MKSINSKSVALFFVRYVGVLLSFVLFFGFMFLLPMLSAGLDEVVWPDAPMVVLVVFLALAVWMGMSLLVAWLVYKNYKWGLTDIGFKKESGVIFKRYVTIPYDKIQNVDIHRSLLHRMLGLSAIHIQTAGFSSGAVAAGRGQVAEGYLPGLLPKEAEKLQDDLLRHRGKATKE